MVDRTVPHDTRDDVVEKFLSKILPGSGTVYRSDWHRRTTAATDRDRPTTTTTRSSTDAAASRLGSTARRRGSSTTKPWWPWRGRVRAGPTSTGRPATTHRVCTSVAIDATGDTSIHVKTICYHVSDDAAPTRS